MRWSNIGQGLFRVLFILYCVEAGVLLTLSPWREIWPRLLYELPWDSIRMALLHPLGRGVVSGFGLVHLVWGLHDLNHLLAGRRGAPRKPDPGPDHAV